VEDHPVAFGQTAFGERQAPQAVVEVGVGAGQVDRQIGAGCIERPPHAVLQRVEVERVVGAVGQFDV